ncbi:acetyl-CoA C-acyltransferase [Govanella unica]|uniref:Acetyl-CoA C-acyltransferase n=1 Tax=Govanella unica TaxID=2975056 RepID=A0A9X3TY54_9PROT|nr:acetyl-CoA C-acyltransferase [Govania unica]
MRETYIYDAVRTPRGKGKDGGSLTGVAPAELVRQLVQALESRQGAGVRDIDHLTLGCVGQIGAQGGHIGLVSRLHSGLPETATVWTLNNYCVSGLSAAMSGADKIAAGSADFVMAGGVESMSQVPFMADRASYYTDPEFSASLRYLPVVLSADVLAQREDVSRETLDEIALVSHQRAARAQTENIAQQSLVPVQDAAGNVLLARDEYVRGNISREALAAFEPAFAALSSIYAPVLKATLGLDAVDHRHTVTHAPGIADGAGLAILGTRDAGEARGLKPRAHIVARSEAAGDPVLSLTSGRVAMERALAKAGLTLADMDVIEYMEAFAVVPALFYRDYKVDRDKVNITGGHVAKGHPLGASGAILLSTLLDVMDERDAEYGLLVAHAASGIGSAVILRRER